MGVWAGVILAYTALRTIRPLRYEDDTLSFVRVLFEVALTVVAVTATGYWSSPLAFSLLTAVAVAGFARGFGFGLQIGVATILAVGIPDVLREDFVADDVQLAAQWAVELLLVALVSGYARRLSGEADLQHSLALDRLGRLADANSLLYSLHQVAQDLPSSLDRDEVLDSTMERLDDLFDYDAASIVVYDGTDETWQVVRRDGPKVLERFTSAELPPPVARAMRLQNIIGEPNLLSSGGPGLSPRAASGMYAPLLARGAIIGMLTVEHGEAFHFHARDVELLAGFAEPAALAVDNANWFSRLRTVGADEERLRIARDLHDRIGQSLAYLAFELDRIVRKGTKGEAVLDSLGELREDVRSVIREVRDTLYDLRTDVSEAKDLESILEEFLDRVRERSGLTVTLRSDTDGRLPVPQERELWRIAQEAVINAERHAEASTITVNWRCDEQSAAVEVADDGKGFPIGRAGRLDSYGLLGMRERASSIGATLEIDSSPGRGTWIRCHLDVLVPSTG